MKLAIYKQGKTIEMLNNNYIVTYECTNYHRVITNKIQIEFLKHFFKNNFSKKEALQKLNNYSMNFNEIVKNKNILTFDKLYRILCNNKNGYYNFGIIKKNRKVLYEYYDISKPLNFNFRLQLRKGFINCDATCETYIRIYKKRCNYYYN